MDKFNQWCVVEVMGHKKFAGRVTEGPFGLVQVDVPEVSVDGRVLQSFTKMLGAHAIYAMTPCTEETAKAFAAQLRAEAFHTYELPALAAPKPKLKVFDDDETFDDCPDPYWAPEGDEVPMAPAVSDIEEPESTNCLSCGTLVELPSDETGVPTAYCPSCDDKAVEANRELMKDVQFPIIYGNMMGFGYPMSHVVQTAFDTLHFVDLDGGIHQNRRWGAMEDWYVRQGIWYVAQSVEDARKTNRVPLAPDDSVAESVDATGIGIPAPTKRFLDPLDDGEPF